MARRNDWIALLGRILLAGMFVVSGFQKISGFEGTVGYIAGRGLPLPQALAALAIPIEIGGGILIIAGWRARWAALGLIVFLIVITPIFHGYWASPPEQMVDQQINFIKNVSILGGMVLLLAFGPGRYSVDRE